MLKSLYVCFFIVFLMSCQQKVEQSEKVVENVEEVQEIKWQQGTVKYFSFEGGFYGIVTSDNGKLLPLNLAQAYQEDNLSISFQGNVLEGVMTIHQWGTPFEISRIKLTKLD